jgi:hypothetical protein
MAANPAREAVLAGLRLIGRSPLAFLAWVGVRLAEQYVSLAILLGAHLSGAVAGVGPVWSVLLSFPFEAVLVSAMLRAELKPQARAFAFLRISAVEANMAGLLVLGYLAGALIALPTTIAVAYAALALKQPLLAQSALLIGSVVAALALLRFAPAAPMLVEGRRLDLVAAWRASRGRYLVLVVIVIGAMALERLVGASVSSLAVQPELNSWQALFSPMRLIILAWRSLTGVAALALMAGAAATVWRESKTTLS